MKTLEQMKESQILKDSFCELFESVKTPFTEMRQYGQVVIISTFAPDFKKKIDKWKISTIIDFDNKKCFGCQSDFMGVDNWTLFERLSLGDLLNQVFPNFKENLIYHLPVNKKFLANALYECTFTCGEIVFAIKEIIAFTQIFNLPNDKINFVFESINKDGIFPYKKTESSSYQDGIALYIENLIAFIKSSPIPIKLKMNGRSAISYGYFYLASDETKKYFKDNGVVIPDVLQVLKDLLASLKVMMVSHNPNIKKIWSWLYKNTTVSEISADDKLWAKYYLSVNKDDKVEVSVLGDLLIKICGLDMTALNGWIESPFSSHTDIISETFKDKGFVAHLEESSHVKIGEDYLGIVCHTAMKQMFTI
jgi:hypothetical protein